ncbi:MAG: 2-oxo-4-hydroxy-4-carboxy-5-ureidoimidazoline decarboxylase [Nocardioides sp.]|uniref:2-oxo-4-hydroxy-4-carboxy-5-ureidoimidazoline decarboxylase n=1 Tax=Nocardioides sp. TaxID=35761 RepID=UPI0039E2C2EB
MDVTEFNEMSDRAAEALIRPCAAIDSFVDALLAARPYADLATLLATAEAQAATWTMAEVDSALADHPRIGESLSREGSRESSSTDSSERAPAAASVAMSSSEQSGVDLTDEDLAARLRRGNRAYEERFGRIYLVRAAGRSTAELVEILEQRLGNDPVTESSVTAAQLGEIALLRLRGIFS